MSSRERSLLLKVMLDDPRWETAAAAFRHAVARAFAGTRWVPRAYRSWNENGVRGVLLHMTIEMTDELPLEELVPRSAFARDPRITLRGQHPHRGRYRCLGWGNGGGNRRRWRYAALGG